MLRLARSMTFVIPPVIPRERSESRNPGEKTWILRLKRSMTLVVIWIPMTDAQENDKGITHNTVHSTSQPIYMSFCGPRQWNRRIYKIHKGQ
jgi:hypothetical protein